MSEKSSRGKMHVTRGMYVGKLPHLAATLWFAAFMMACSKSPPGSVEELVKTRAPTFGGFGNRTFLSPSTTYVLNGECDPISYAVLYSYDQSTWNEIAGGCPNGTFTINVSLSRQVKVYVRAKTKTGFTASGVATIRLLLPPTDPFMKLTASGRADDELVAGGGQNDMSFMSAESLNNGLKIIKTSLADIIYGD